MCVVVDDNLIKQVSLFVLATAARALHTDLHRPLNQAGEATSGEGTAESDGEELDRSGCGPAEGRGVGADDVVEELVDAGGRGGGGSESNVPQASSRPAHPLVSARLPLGIVEAQVWQHRPGWT
jgi:hypothetical protein